MTSGYTGLLSWIRLKLDNIKDDVRSIDFELVDSDNSIMLERLRSIRKEIRELCCNIDSFQGKESSFDDLNTLENGKTGI